MTNLNPDEVKSLGTAMYQVQDIDQDTVNMVLDEFLSIIKANTALGFGATNYISTVMSKALGQEKAQSVLSKITPQDAQKPIDILQWMDAKSISELINDEHPQIIAVILSLVGVVISSSWDSEKSVVMNLLQREEPKALGWDACDSLANLTLNDSFSKPILASEKISTKLSFGIVE